LEIVMLQATCGKCGEIFVPADEQDLEHGIRNDGEPCGGTGVDLGGWVFTGDHLELVGSQSLGTMLAIAMDDLNEEDTRSDAELEAYAEFWQVVEDAVDGRRFGTLPDVTAMQEIETARTMFLEAMKEARRDR
jgi:hypothetical protein